MMINCDIGERGISHPVDLELMNYIHIANIACGGHTGDRESVRFFRDLASEKGVMVTAHLSYPDRENFGRKAMDITTGDLLSSLQEQYSLMKGVETVKLHGALYNGAAAQEPLAESLSDWFVSAGVSQALCPPGSALARSCARRGIKILQEAFAERTYTWDSRRGQLYLTPRSEPKAHLTTVEDAWKQFRQLRDLGTVSAFVDGSVKEFPLDAETVCIHSDSPIALELAEKLYGHT